MVGGSVAYIFNSSFVGNAAIEPLIPADIAKKYLRAIYNDLGQSGNARGAHSVADQMPGADFMQQLDSRNALVK